MIYGVGTDICMLSRIESMKSLDVFAEKILSDNEKKTFLSKDETQKIKLDNIYNNYLDKYPYLMIIPISIMYIGIYLFIIKAISYSDNPTNPKSITVLSIIILGFISHYSIKKPISKSLTKFGIVLVFLGVTNFSFLRLLEK